MNKVKEVVKERIENTFKKIEEDPNKMKIVRGNLEDFRRDAYLPITYIQKWDEVLTLPLPKIKELLLADTEEGELLRSTSIFIRIE